MSRRIEALDVLRGVAILGTLGTNIWLFTHPLGPPGAFAGLPPADTVAGGVEAVLRYLANGKYLALLTLLFGIGLELQYQSARRRRASWPGWYLWRAGLLFVEGLLHYLLVFEFDVLMGYAVTSMIVAWLIGRSDRAVRAWMVGAGAVAVVIVGVLTTALLAAPGSSEDAIPISFPTESWADQVADRLALAPLYRAETVLIIPMGIVLFLAGARLLRAGALADDPAGRRIRRRLMVVGLGVAAPLNLVTTFAGSDWALVDRYLLPPFVSLGLLALVTTLVHRLDRRSCAAPVPVAWVSAAPVPGAGSSRAGAPGPLRTGLTAVGRTALSCYILQNVLASALCYGWGLGLAARFADLRPWWVIGAWLGICGVCMVLAVWWLRRFDRGPVELVWQWAYRAPQRITADRSAQPARPAQPVR